MTKKINTLTKIINSLDSNKKKRSQRGERREIRILDLYLRRYDTDEEDPGDDLYWLSKDW